MHCKQKHQKILNNKYVEAEGITHCVSNKNEAVDIGVNLN